MLRRLVFFLTVLSIFGNLQIPTVQAAGNCAVLDLDPQKTYAVIAGVLKWPKNAALSPFKQTDRKDLGLYAALVLRGVPKANLTLLMDRQATKPNILEAIGSQARQAPPGSLFIFYYAGHGGKSDTGVVSFASYDCVPTDSLSGVTMQDIAAAVKDNFKGRRVLFMADCCYSGGLGQAAQELATSGYETASLTSADASNLSAWTWNFTQTVIEGLRGDPLLDLNNDGVISLQEIGDDVREWMKYREDQLYGYRCYGLKDDFRLVPVDTLAPRRSMPPGGKFALKEFVHAPDGGHQGVGRILGRSQGGYTVEFMDYSAKRIREVDEAKLDKIQFKRYPVGRDVTVLWNGAPYAAKILKVEGDFHWITYPGWPSYWDEWVLSTRIIDEPPGKVEKVGTLPNGIKLVPKSGIWEYGGIWNMGTLPVFSRSTGKAGPFAPAVPRGHMARL